ncbi:hypothetical protein DTL42_01615 [Bremerella cremea]|uniref:SLA1 homology domain-containing protein n=1 Tax=Bremerella cremea TaxID=1031537 RepID=A0A368KXN5_9BACT|nr:hypothetical protein [Bremerella cremea]RCS53892.1 hypothetical protein DTL42_01615 [Bremerella cremea]
MSNHRPRYFLIGTLAFVATGLLSSMLLAQGGTPYFYPPSQTMHTWKGKGGSLVFSGRAVERKGDFISFKTSKNIEITLPLKYLSQDDHDYLNHLAGNGPAPAATSRPSDSQPAPAGMTPVGMTPVEENDGEAPPADFFGPSPGPATGGEDPFSENPFQEVPADSATGSPGQLYKQGDEIEIVDDGTWYSGTILAVRPADNTYYVRFSKSDIPFSRWVSAQDLRLPGGAQPSDMPSQPLAEDPFTEKKPTSVTTQEVMVDSQLAVGYMIGAVKKGDTIRLSYISGKWKAWGRLASESPDAEYIGGGEKCRLALSALENQSEIVKLAVVPGMTDIRPFTWTADKDYPTVFLQINDTDGDFSSNPPSDVKYSLSIEKPLE